ncbi:MAG: dihydroorotate dehydrogenase-like protein [Methylococcaceae bacterium]
MDLTCAYMGMNLKNPVIASASPLSESLSGMQQLEDSGVSAIVMHSLFEEQIRQDEAALSRLLMQGTFSQAESSGYFPVTRFDSGPDQYLKLLERASGALDIPVIASFNCMSESGWIEYAIAMEQAGASGIELNIYSIEANLDVSASSVEQRYLDIVSQVKQAVTIPVALKLSPFFSSMGHIARQLDNLGINGLVLFNRFYQPDIDINTLTLHSSVQLSQADEIRLPMLWIALLFGKINASLAATRGVETWVEVVKYLLAGTDVVMTTSALLRNGPAYTGELLAGLCNWMDDHEFESVKQMRGVMSHGRVADPGAFERANYVRILAQHG